MKTLNGKQQQRFVKSSAASSSKKNLTIFSGNALTSDSNCASYTRPEVVWNVFPFKYPRSFHMRIIFLVVPKQWQRRIQDTVNI